MTAYRKSLFFFFINFALIFSSVVLLSSCEATLFDKPQPVDAINIYEFPKKFRGSWVIEKDTITIAKDYYRSTNGDDTVKIIKGLYVNPIDTMAFDKTDSVTWKRRLALSKPFFSLQTIKFDSLKNPIDTTTNFIVRKNMIYEVRSGGIEAGSPFYIEHDTIYRIIKRLPTEVELGRSAFLREITKDRYLVNIKANLYQEAGDGWWIIYLLEMKPDKKIFIGDIEQSKMNESERIFESGDNQYFDSRWTKQDAQRLIQEGLFKEDDMTLDDKNRIRKR